ncbi:hypothetical protein [Alistipes sp.]|uniref:hypothetical protein n=1 Tax=Alistipes sp. TaxID=1872444 RepID=UPI000E82D9E4|nr:hypothetical protein [Alistipes sp.]HBX90156.1 hypothetical protein [Alistipes sp.]
MDPLVVKIVHAALLPLFCAGALACGCAAAGAGRRWLALAVGLAGSLVLAWWARCRVFDLLAAAAVAEAHLLSWQVVGANLLPAGAVGYGAACLARRLRWRDVATVRGLWLLGGVAAAAALLWGACLATRALLG